MAKPTRLLNTIKDINLLVSSAISSLKIKELRIEERDEIFSMRPNIHLMLQATTGSLKSTILQHIQRVSKSIEATAVTVPGLIGTIENGMLVPGFAWKARNKLMLFDEFKLSNNREGAVVLLKLLEDQYYAKKFGRFIMDRKPERSGDLYYKVENGSIEIKTRFSAILATMLKFENQSGIHFRAFVSRTIPYSYDFTLEEMSWLLERTSIFRPKPFNPEPKILVDWKNYRKLKGFVFKELESYECQEWVKLETFTRLVGDIIRFRYTTGIAKRAAFKKIIKYKVDSYSRIGLAKRERKPKWK